MEVLLKNKEEEVLVKVEKKNRKTISLKIDENLQVLLSVPNFISQEEINDIIEDRRNWIFEKRESLKRRIGELPSRAIVDGNRLLYLGKEYTIKIIYDITLKKSQVNICNEYIYIYTNTKEEKKLNLLIENWYRSKTLFVVKECIKKYEGYFNSKATSIKVKKQKARWGSCTSKGGLLFNLKISRAPMEICEYIVVHEMCHLIHMNHSKEYWQEVERVLPNYRELDGWLRNNGYKINY